MGLFYILILMTEDDKKDVRAVLDFWFKETDPKQRFIKDPVFDARIKDRFGELYWKLLDGLTTTWRETAEGRLAEIIILDQFARNMFRDNAQSFMADPIALQLARAAIEIGADKEVPEEQRAFFYLPFMHSESSEVHEEALRIFTDFGNQGNLEYEIKHKNIIDRFGRYPHRNKILGRESTPEELEFLKDNPGF
jgi:uncharacterized protein (DUF924 family)